MHKYTLIRSKRKTVALHIRPDATIEVRAPLKMPKTDIDQFVDSQKSWIDKKLPIIRERSDKKAAFSLDYGDTVLLRGKEYSIIAKPGNRVGFDDAYFCVPPDLCADSIKYACVQIYKLVAKQIFTNKTINFAKQMGVMPAAVKINSAKTRWGSCSAQKNVNYSWRLVMAEDDVIDYVVVHELAHLAEMNHSDKFWAIVARILPDYKVRQERLKILQQRLGNEDWE